MSCSGTASKFTITRGVKNTFVFTIKKNNSTLPININVSDTFTATLKNLETDAVALVKSLTVDSAINGRVKLEFTDVEATALTSKRGGKEDRFYLLPVYNLVLSCSTVDNGAFLARIESVYVD